MSVDRMKKTASLLLFAGAVCIPAFGQKASSAKHSNPEVSIDSVRKLVALRAFESTLERPKTRPPLSDEIPQLPAFRAVDIANMPSGLVQPATRVLTRLLRRDLQLTMRPPDDAPMTYVLTEDGARTFAIIGFDSSNVYNSLRMTPKECAADMFSTVVIPYVRSIGKEMGATDLKKYALGVTFRRANAVKDYLSPEGHALFVVVPRSAAGQFLSGDITDQELADASAVFLSEGSPDFVRVKVTLE